MDPEHHHHPDLHRLAEAAIEAEYETGRREPTRKLAVRHVVMRLVRIVLSFFILITGFAMLVLPGPGLALIAVALLLLSRDFVWAERLLRKVTDRLPEGVQPENLGKGKLAGAIAFGLGTSVAAWWFFA